MFLVTSVMDSGLDKPNFIEMFHANTDDDSKTRIIDQFVSVNGEVKILVCTVAFGMGVNIPNIDLVVHWGVPTSSLAYWQEVGRAARDGRTGYAKCYAYRRSMAKTEDKSLQNIIGKCVRVSILEQFQLEGMDSNAIQSIRRKEKCDGNCVEKCTCSFCRCCFFCCLLCCCPAKHVNPFRNFLINVKWTVRKVLHMKLWSKSCKLPVCSKHERSNKGILRLDSPSVCLFCNTNSKLISKIISNYIVVPKNLLSYVLVWLWSVCCVIRIQINKEIVLWTM